MNHTKRERELLACGHIKDRNAASTVPVNMGLRDARGALGSRHRRERDASPTTRRPLTLTILTSPCTGHSTIGHSTAPALASRRRRPDDSCGAVQGLYVGLAARKVIAAAIAAPPGDGRPCWGVTEEPHCPHHRALIDSEAMVGAGGEDNHIAGGDGDAHPLVCGGADIKVTAALEDVAGGAPTSGGEEGGRVAAAVKSTNVRVTGGWQEREQPAIKTV